jgi:hypothetical protein
MKVGDQIQALADVSPVKNPGKCWRLRGSQRQSGRFEKDKNHFPLMDFFFPVRGFPPLIHFCTV